MSNLIDLSLLQLLKHRGDYFQIQGRIPEKTLDPATTLMLKMYGKYFDAMPDAQVIDPQKLLTIFRTSNPEMKPETKLVYEGIITNIMKDITDEEKSGVMRSLLDLRLGTDIANVISKWDGGDIENLHAVMRDLSDEYERDADIKGLDFIRPDLDTILAATVEEGGLQFRLSCLRDTMRGLRPGDFGILAARPDRGKTTFLASEVTHMATQLPPGKTVLWLNNEGDGDRVYIRLVQAALGLTAGELRVLPDKAGDYLRAIGGNDPYKIRIVNIHGQDTYAVENIIKQNNPGLIIYDMIDNIRGFGSDSGKDHATLEAMYSWARELSFKYQCAGIATSQISNEGDNMSYPSMGMLKDSKTGKQGACDFIIMVGAMNDPAYDGFRYIGTPKNKLRREGAKACPRATVAFRPQIARFEDMPIVAQV